MKKNIKKERIKLKKEWKQPSFQIILFKDTKGGARSATYEDAPDYFNPTS